MKIFPAIDIEDGHCVRLQQGRKENLTVYGDDPVKMALKWQEEGAKALHVVDLDGAFKGDGVNKEIIRKMCEALTIPIEVGGGIRSEKAIKDYLDMGGLPRYHRLQSRRVPLFCHPGRQNIRLRPHRRIHRCQG